MRVVIVAALATALAGLAAAQVPIPRTYDGFSLGPADAPLSVEFFYDLMCPASRASWPVMREVAAHFKKTVRGSNSSSFAATRSASAPRLRSTLHLFPLPYHHNSFLTAQAARALGDRDETLVWRWMEAVYAAQERLGNAATENMTPAQVKSALADLAEAHGLPARAVAEGLASADADGAARVSWKYACYRGVYGTPMFLVNGAPAPQEAGGWSARQWISFLEELDADKHAVLALETALMS